MCPLRPQKRGNSSVWGCGTRVIQVGDTTKLMKTWKEKGNPLCGHPDTDKEYYLGMSTGDDVCLVCGEAWPRGTRLKSE